MKEYRTHHARNAEGVEWVGHHENESPVAWTGDTRHGVMLRAGDKNDADERRGHMFWWGVYYEGPFMPATYSGWARTLDNAKRHAERVVRERGGMGWS